MWQTFRRTSFQETSFLSPLSCKKAKFDGCPEKDKTEVTSVNSPIHTIAIKIYIMHRSRAFKDSLWVKKQA